MSERLDGAVAARRRAQAITGLRGLATRPVGRTPARDGQVSAQPSDVEVCDLCGVTIPEDHRHLLHLTERRIACSCEACWGMRAGEGDYRPVGNRTVWLERLEIPDDVWAGFDTWNALVKLNPVLADLEPDVEGLIVNRLSDPPAYAIAPIDRCYALTGAVKATWDGISGGTGVDHAVTRFFDDLRAAAVVA
jgi:hypothetical protein